METRGEFGAGDPVVVKMSVSAYQICARKESRGARALILLKLCVFKNWEMKARAVMQFVRVNKQHR